MSRILKLMLFILIYIIISAVILCKGSFLGLIMLALTIPIFYIGIAIIGIKNAIEKSKIEKENHDNLEIIANSMRNIDE